MYAVFGNANAIKLRPVFWLFHGTMLTLSFQSLIV